MIRPRCPLAAESPKSPWAPVQPNGAGTGALLPVGQLRRARSNCASAPLVRRWKQSFWRQFKWSAARFAAGAFRLPANALCGRPALGSSRGCSGGTKARGASTEIRKQRARPASQCQIDLCSRPPGPLRRPSGAGGDERSLSLPLARSLRPISCRRLYSSGGAACAKSCMSPRYR